MQTVTLYSGPYCPYCMMAKMLLKQVGVSEIVEINSMQDPVAFEKMMQETGTRTVPQIFIGKTHVGGFTDLRALHMKGELEPLLNGED
ncbi:MAG: glutaredoxin 3 [Neisseria sp.]|nr:glutaredoxin 3 [Neisseria sp.]